MDNQTIGLIVCIVLLLIGLSVVLYLWLSNKCEEKKCEEKKITLDQCKTAFNGPTGCNQLNSNNCGSYTTLDQCRTAFTGPTGCPNLSNIKLYDNVQYTFTSAMTGSAICADTTSDKITVYGIVNRISGTGDNATARIIPNSYVVTGPTTSTGGRCANIANEYRASRYQHYGADTLAWWISQFWGFDDESPTYPQLSNLGNVPVKDIKPYNYK